MNNMGECMSSCPVDTHLSGPSMADLDCVEKDPSKTNDELC